MILFLIKKTFFDVWDNLLSIFLINIGAVLLLGGCLSVLQHFEGRPSLFIAGIILTLVVLMLYIGTASQLTKEMADFKSPDFKHIFATINKDGLASLVFGVMLVLQVFVVGFAIPWYFARGNLLGIALAGLLFWGNLLWMLASQYYFPVRNRLDTKIRQIPKRCLMLLFDNTGFTIALGLGTLVLVILSFFTAFLFPGIGVILLWHQVAVRLRVYKYDYFEEYPDGARKRIPWERLLAEDKDRVGTRTLRGMIFPWKG